MICTWICPGLVIEIDADTKAEETKRLRELIKEQDIRLEDMVKEK